MRHLQHSSIGGRKECSGRSLAPLGGPEPEVWLCACLISDEQFNKLYTEVGGGYDAEAGVAGLERGEEMDRLVAVKVEGELNSFRKTEES
jgi:hypothetical protein